MKWAFHTVVISTQHHPDATAKTIRKNMIAQVIQDVIPAKFLDRNTIYHVNPTGRFVHGGPAADTGLTGRKIIVDTYGGMGRHGGGAFSGKDPTKVDRSASYVARYVAKNLVAAGLARRAEVQLTQLRQKGTLPYLRPDAKSQVTVEYEGDLPVRVDEDIEAVLVDPPPGQITPDLGHGHLLEIPDLE